MLVSSRQLVMLLYSFQLVWSFAFFMVMNALTKIFTLEGPADSIAYYYSYFQAVSDHAIIQPEKDRLKSYPQFFVSEREVTEGQHCWLFYKENEIKWLRK